MAKSVRVELGRKQSDNDGHSACSEACGVLLPIGQSESLVACGEDGVSMLDELRCCIVAEERVVALQWRWWIGECLTICTRT